MAMKFRAHDTFFIRKGWLSKGMKYVHSKPDVFVAKDENPMDVLGIGANMVKALRYWLQAVGLTEEPNSGKRVQTFTPLGQSVFTNDRYIEELGTLYLLHYRLSSNKTDATAWYYFFNEFTMSEFSRDDFVEFLQRRIRMEDSDAAVAIRSLNDDFSCIINTYLPRYKTSPTSIFDSDSKAKLFERNVDVYANAPLVGFLYGRTAEPDDTRNPETNQVFNQNVMGDRVIYSQEELLFNFRLIMLLDKEYEPDEDVRINKAFRHMGEDPADEARFDSYVRGGVDVLYEKLIEGVSSPDEYVMRLYDFVEEFQEKFNEEMSNEDILKLCSK